MVIHSTVGELIKGTKQPLLNEREKNIWSVIIHFNFSNQCCQFCTDNMCVTLCTVSIVHQMKFRYLLLQRVAPPQKNSGEMIMYMIAVLSITMPLLPIGQEYLNCTSKCYMKKNIECIVVMSLLLIQFYLSMYLHYRCLSDALFCC